jgi:hypothetical protein
LEARPEGFKPGEILLTAFVSICHGDGSDFTLAADLHVRLPDVYR